MIKPKLIALGLILFGQSSSFAQTPDFSRPTPSDRSGAESVTVSLKSGTPIKIAADIQARLSMLGVTIGMTLSEVQPIIAREYGQVRVEDKILELFWVEPGVKVVAQSEKFPGVLRARKVSQKDNLKIVDDIVLQFASPQLGGQLFMIRREIDYSGGSNLAPGSNVLASQMIEKLGSPSGMEPSGRYPNYGWVFSRDGRQRPENVRFIEAIGNYNFVRTAYQISAGETMLALRKKGHDAVVKLSMQHGSYVGDLNATYLIYSNDIALETAGRDWLALNEALRPLVSRSQQKFQENRLGPPKL